MKKMLLPLLLLVALVACQGTPPPPPPLSPTAATTTGQTGGTESVIQSTTPIAAEAAGRPLSLAAPALNLQMPITEMGWQVTEVNGERKATWEVPQDSAGWHLNSAQPGTAGNLILSGHHLLGAAVFAPLARGEMTVGMQLLITDDQGRTFLYQVREVSSPLPALGASAAEQQQATAYLAPSTSAILTLVTGWPAFSDTHYVFVVADFVGMLS